MVVLTVFIMKSPHDYNHSVAFDPAFFNIENILKIKITSPGAG